LGGEGGSGGGSNGSFDDITMFCQNRNGKRIQITGIIINRTQMSGRRKNKRN